MTIDPGTGHIPARYLGRRLRDAREDAGLSQTELASKIEVGRRTVVRYESARSLYDVQRKTMAAWALATGVPLTWLETGAVPNRPEGPGQAVLLPHLDSNQKPFGYRLAS